MNGGSNGLRPLRELANAVGTLTGWGSFGGDPPPQRKPCGPGVLAIQSVIMIGVAAVWCLAKIAFYGGEMAAGWLVVFVPLALPLALATALRPPRMALGLSTGGLAAVAAGLLAVLFFRTYVAGFWLAFLGLSVASLVAGTVFGYVTTAPGRTSA
jgi:hypothetical protein